MIQRGVVLLVVFAGGFSALVYQIIWQRLLAFITGTGTASVTIIVAAVMAGLGLGSLAGAHISDRLTPRARLRLIGTCELAVAAFAWISVPLFYNVLYARLGTEELPAIAAAALHAGATLWPTFFMGLAFPLLARSVAAGAPDPARSVATLFGWNTLGAATGALVTVTILMPSQDFGTMVRFAAAINAACAIIMFAMSRNAVDQDDQRVTATAITAAPSNARFATWVALFAASGFIALALEIVWFRVLGVILKADAGTFGRLLTLYLGGLALGALVSGLPFARRWNPRRSYLLLQAAVPIYSGLAIAAFVVAIANVPLIDRLSPYLAGAAALNQEARWSPTGLVIGWLVPMALMSVPTFLMGLSFGSLHRAVQTRMIVLGQRVGWLQAANIAGAVSGALATGFILIDRVGSIGTVRLLMGAGLLFLILAARERGGGRSIVIAKAVFVALAITVLPDRLTLWSRMHGVETAGAIITTDRSGVVVMKGSPQTTLLLVNGRGQSELPYQGLQTDLGIVPTMLHPRPRRVAVIGLGSGNTSFSAGGRPETRVDTIEIVAPVMTALKQFDAVHGYPALRQLLTDPRMHYAVADGRAFLSKTAIRYDVIEADALRPESAYAGNLYSLEYFSLVRSRLNAGGYAVSWLPTFRVRETLREAFPYVVIWGELGIGSERPIVIDAAQIRRRLADPFTERYFSNAGVDANALFASYLADSPEVLSPQQPRPRRSDLNRDLFPRDEFNIQD